MKKNSAPDTDILISSIKKAYFLFSRQIDGKITAVSPAVQTMLGYDSEEFALIYPHFQLVKCMQNSIEANGASSCPEKQRSEYNIQINHKNGSPHWLKIVELPVVNQKGEIISYDCIAHDITGHVNNTAHLLYSEKRLRDALGHSIRVLATTVESRDYFSYGHHQRSSSIARLIAQDLGMSAESIDTIRLAAVIHDIGKITVPSEILNKRNLLSDTDYSFIHSHPEAGYNILKGLDIPWPFAEIVLQHHERMNGSGYPYQLQGDQILPESRVLAVADVIEAMASDRAYRSAMDTDSIMDEICVQRGILFDPDVVDASMRLLSENRIIL